MATKKKKTIVAVSGGFDPVHIGHIRMFERAKEMGDHLVVILNNDNWLRKKKQHIFMPDNERKELIEKFRVVDEVMLTSHDKDSKDMSVSLELQKLRPDIFANGGDRNEKDATNPESSLYKDMNTCNSLGIKMVFNIGDGGKVQSSSWLLEKYVKQVSSKTDLTKEKEIKVSEA